MTPAGPNSKEQYAAHLPALHLLCNLGWDFLSTAQALALRGSTREVILRSRLVEVLQTRRYEYKGQWYPLSSSGIEQVVRELSAVSLAEGLLPANERLYGKLALGITVTEFMPDGKKHQPTIAVIDWADPTANRWDVTEELELPSAQGTHYRTPDVVGFVNGLPLVVIEAKRPESTHAGKSMVAEGISQHLRNQRPDEIPQLFGYAQLLMAISQTEGRYGTTATAAKFWARWREEEFDAAHLAAVKNAPLPADVRRLLFEGKPAGLAAYFDALWSATMEPTDQDRLLASLLTPARLLEYLRSYVLFDRKVGKIVARYQQFFGIRALLARIRQVRPDGGREGGVVWHTTGSGKSFSMVFLTKALLLVDALAECRVLVIGVAYKANVNDMRESPALRIVELLRAEGGNVEYHDPFVPTLPKLGLASIPLTPDSAREFDVVVVVTAHDGIDWEMVGESANLIVDLRNVIPSSDGKVWRL